jgi:hypothetical protein
MEVYTIRGSWNGTDQLSELSQARSAKLWYSTNCLSICISESQCGSIQIQSKQRNSKVNDTKTGDPDLVHVGRAARGSAHVVSHVEPRLCITKA